MISLSASGPAGAWGIASTRIPPFISKLNEHRSSGGGLRWFVAFTKITTKWLVGGKAIILIGFPFHTYIVGAKPRLLMLFNAQKTVELPWDQDELHQYQQIHCSGPGQTPFRKMFRTDTFPLPTRMISYQNQLDVHAQQLTALSNDVFACKFVYIMMSSRGNSFIQAATGYKCWKLPFSLVFRDHFSAKQ